MDDTDAGGLFELISNFQVKLESLFEQYNKHSAKVTQLVPSSKIHEMLPNSLSADVWQRAKQAVKKKISLKYEANASFEFDRNSDSSEEDDFFKHGNRDSSRKSQFTSRNSGDNIVEQVFSIAEKPYILETPTDWSIWAVKTQH